MLVVQGYEPGLKYNETHAHILSFVAIHVSSAIKHYQALNELGKSEERYRTVIEKRRRGEPVNEMYAFRVVTANGDICSLKLSAFKIEWGKRASTFQTWFFATS